MNIVLGSAFLLLTGIFYILVSGEKGNRKQKGARWIQRWGRKHGWQLPEWMTEECIWQTELAVLVAGVLLIAAGVTEQAENGQEISQLRRPAYGQGIQEENLEVEWRDEQGNRKKESMTVDVIEKQLSEKEIETIFSEVRGAIEKEILGENESLKHVDHPLYLREELQEYPVTVRWFSSRPEILDWEGRHGENIREDGEAVTLTGLLLVGLGCAPIYPSIIHATPGRFGADRSQAIIGVQMASAYIGNCLMPPLFGVIANHTTIAIFPYYLLVILILMGYMHEALQKKTKAAQ